MPVLSVVPQHCLQDEKIIVTASELRPYQPITFTSHLKDPRDKLYFVYTHYIADGAGLIDLTKHWAVGGHYTGIFQMGLIAAFKPAPHEYQYLRIFKKDIEKPNEIEIRIYDRHLTPEEIFSPNYSPLATAIHYRHFMAPGVKKIEIRDGRVRGSFFLPPGQGPFPGVVDMFGTAGGLLEYRSAQLASRGIAALALAFFDYDDLPKELYELDMSYFEEAVHVLLKQEKVCKPHVGVIGVSKGGDLALSMATFIPQVSLAICINGCYSNLSNPLKINDEITISPLTMEMGKIQIMNSEVIMNLGTVNDNKDFPETIIPIHTTDANLMFIVGKMDLNMICEEYALGAVELMRKVGKKNFKVCMYEGAGHLIEPPYSPFCFASYHKVFDMALAWGGELKAHTEAQEKSWIEIITYIKDHLSNQLNSKL